MRYNRTTRITKVSKPNQLSTNQLVEGTVRYKQKKNPLHNIDYHTYKGYTNWNVIPVDIRDSSTYTAFKSQIKVWRRNNQTCEY